MIEMSKDISLETKKFILEVKKFTKELLNSKEKAKKFLIQTGIYTKKGNLTKHYH